MIPNAVVSRDEWVAARKELLTQEKALTRERDRLSQLRRELPWEVVEKEYVFDTPDGRRSLSDLFEGRSQLVVYHMMAKGPLGSPCPVCSFWADSFTGIIPHLNDRDVTLVVISRAPLELLQAHKRRMGWPVLMASSESSDFNADYGVYFTEEQLQGEVEYNYARGKWPLQHLPGVSVFARGDDGQVFHTYSTYARGLDALNNTYQYLDLVPKGRNEDGLPAPVAWIRYHDEYQQRAPSAGLQLGRGVEVGTVTEPNAGQGPEREASASAAPTSSRARTVAQDDRYLAHPLEFWRPGQPVDDE